MAKLAPDLPDSYSGQPAGAQVDGRGGAGRPLDRATDAVLLAQPAQGSRLPVPGAGGAHQLRRPASISAAITSSTAAITWTRITNTSRLSKEELLERFLPAFKRVQPRFRPQLGQGDLALEDGLRPARAAAEPFAEHPAPAHARPRPLLRQHEPGLPVGSRHELRRGDRAEGGGDGDGRLGVTRDA